MTELGDTADWPPSTELVVQAQEGNRVALASILRAAHPRLVGFFRGSGPQPADADDLAAHTMEAVITSLHKLKNPAAFEGWFWQIARFTFRGWIRKTRRPSRFEKAYPTDPSVESHLETLDEHSLIRSALERLSTNDRQLIWLREVEELSYEEIGSKLGSALGTVRVACHRARKRLEQAYLEMEGED